MHHLIKKYVTCQHVKGAVICSLSSLSHSNDIYLHGSTSIGGHFAAIECSTVTGELPSEFYHRFCSPLFVSDIIMKPFL